MGFLLKFFYALLTLLVLLHTRLSLGSNGEAMKKCIARERKALLLFKHGIYADSDMVSAWREGDDEDCCNWKGVSCSKQIGHVQILDLHGSDDYSLYLRGTQLQGFNASCYDGNLDLCGLPLNKKCPGDNKMPPPQEANHDEEEEASLFSQEFYLSMGLGFFVGFWAFVGPLLFNQTWRQGYYRFLNTVTDKVYVMVAIYVVKYLTIRD